VYTDFVLMCNNFSVLKLFDEEINREIYNHLHIHNFTPQKTTKSHGKI